MCNSPEEEVHVIESADADAADADAADSASEVDEESEGSDYDDENHDIIRAKWQIDGSKTLDECVEKLQNFIAYIQGLKAAGWELTQTVDDDYGFIRRDAPSLTSRLATMNTAPQMECVTVANTAPVA